MARLESPQAGATVIGVAVFQIWQAWNNTAPTLKEARDAAPGDVTIRQALLDADMTVGSLAVVVSIAFWYLTGEASTAVLLMTTFVMLSVWTHQVLAAESR